VTEAEEDYQRALGHQAGERAALQARIGGPASALVRGVPSEQDIGALVGEGTDLSSIAELLRPRTPVRGTPPYLKMLDEERGIYDLHENPRADRGLPTFSQAMALLEQRYGTYDEQGFRTGFSKPWVDIYDEAQALARGEEPAAPQPARGAMAGYPDEDVEKVMRHERVPRKPREGAGAPAPAAEAPAPTAQPASARRVITRDQADYLRDVRGMSEDEINRLYDISG
jgi:hypothetical protein